jgi:hypothetical protein
MVVVAAAIHFRLSAGEWRWIILAIALFGAVLAAAVVSLVIGSTIFLPRLAELAP